MVKDGVSEKGIRKKKHAELVERGLTKARQQKELEASDDLSFSPVFFSR